MTVNLTPYLNFRGTAREAMEFYRSVLGGELTVSTFQDLGMEVGAGEESQVMHSQLLTEGGLLLMGSDVPSKMGFTPGENQFSVSLSGDDEAVLSGYFAGLSEGATISMPLEKAPWGDSFGMLVDRFGVAWLVNISGGGAA